MIQAFYSKLSEKEKKFFNLTVVIVVLALFDRLFFSPFLGKLNDINQEIDRQKSEITRDLKFLSYKDKILKENEFFSRYFSEDVEDEDVINAAFLRKIEQLATQTNVNLVKSNPSEAKKKKRYDEYFANLDATGKLEDMIAFMHAINTSDDLLKVVKFNMVPKSGERKDIVNASMAVEKMVITPGVKTAEEEATQ